MTQQNDPMIKLGGLWQNEGRNGKYLSGTLGMAKLLIFENNHRDNDNSPTHIAYLAPAPRRDEGTQRTNSAGNARSSRGSFGGGHTQRTEPLAGDPPGTERFEIRPGELDPTDEDSIPF